MLLRIVAAVGLVLALAATLYAVAGLRGRSGYPSFASAFRVGCLTLGSASWLVLASTALIWVFPLNLAASAAIGYFGAKQARSAFPKSEVKAFVWLSLAVGGAIAAAIASTGDSFMLYVAAPYSLLNAAAMVGSSYLALRPVRSEA